MYITKYDIFIEFPCFGSLQTFQNHLAYHQGMLHVPPVGHIPQFENCCYRLNYPTVYKTVT